MQAVNLGPKERVPMATACVLSEENVMVGASR